MPSKKDNILTNLTAEEGMEIHREFEILSQIPRIVDEYRKTHGSSAARPKPTAPASPNPAYKK